MFSSGISIYIYLDNILYPFLYRVEGKRPTLAKALGIGADDCLLEIFKPIGRSSTTYSAGPIRSGHFDRSVILACKIPIEENVISNTDGENETRLVMRETPTAILKELGINWNQ